MTESKTNQSMTFVEISHCNESKLKADHTIYFHVTNGTGLLELGVIHDNTTGYNGCHAYLCLSLKQMGFNSMNIRQLSPETFIYQLKTVSNKSLCHSVFFFI